MASLQTLGTLSDPLPTPVGCMACNFLQQRYCISVPRHCREHLTLGTARSLLPAVFTCSCSSSRPGQAELGSSWHRNTSCPAASQEGREECRQINGLWGQQESVVFSGALAALAVTKKPLSSLKGERKKYTGIWKDTAGLWQLQEDGCSAPRCPSP